MHKTMKKATLIMMVTLLIASSILIAGCASSNNSSSAATNTNSEEVLSQVMTAGKIRVAISLGNQPWCWKDTDGQIKGLAIDLIQGFADSIGVKVEYVPLEFSGLIPAIQADKADIIATNLTRKPSRATMVLYTEPVGSSHGVVIIQKGKFTSIDQLNSADVTLTTESGSVYEDVGKTNFPEATMSPTGNNSDALEAVKAGRADAMVTDLAIATAATKADSSIEFLTPYIYTDTLAFAAKDSADAYTFVEAFNIYLRVAKADGTYGKLYTKYFGTEWIPTYTDSGM